MAAPHRHPDAARPLDADGRQPAHPAQRRQQRRRHPDATNPALRRRFRRTARHRRHPAALHPPPDCSRLLADAHPPRPRPPARQQGGRGAALAQHWHRPHPALRTGKTHHPADGRLACHRARRRAGHRQRHPRPAHHRRPRPAHPDGTRPRHRAPGERFRLHHPLPRRHAALDYARRRCACCRRPAALLDVRHQRLPARSRADPV